MPKIDFVILWVDGSDETWLKEKNKYTNKKIDLENGAKKYRDYDTVRYLFRSIEKYAPFVNNIFFVTYGHLPKWLNTNNPKLKIVKHEDFIAKKYLPTFNANTIELNIHKIKGLSDNFVYFNDDIIITNSLSSDDFFKNNLPCDSWEEDILVLDKDTDLNFSYILVNDLSVINANFNKRNAIKNNFTKWFNFKYGKGLIKNLFLVNWKNIAGFYNYHLPTAYQKQTFKEVWEKEKDILEQSCLTKFRDDHDVNQYVMKLWQIYSGKFVPKKYKHFGECFTLSDDNTDLYKYIENHNKKIICIIDGEVKDFDKVKKELTEKLDKLFPDKCSFEK